MTASPSTALTQLSLEQPTVVDAYEAFYGKYVEPAGAPPNAEVRGDDQVSTMAVLDRLLGRYDDHVHELPDDMKFAASAMPMAPYPMPFVLSIQAAGMRL